MRQAKRFQDFLSKHRLKKTSQRALVWETLQNADDHPSVQEIRERMLEKGHRIGLSTIYRTINVLLESGMIRQLKLRGTTRYEIIVGQPNHIHFVCNRCGNTQEFPSQKLENLIRQETEKHDFQPVFSRYAILGLCRACDRHEAREAGSRERERQQKILARDALELALAVERRGYSFYTRASKKTRDPGGRRMFEDLAHEESEHMDRLWGQYRALLEENRWLRREPARLPVSRKIADSIFPERELLSVDVRTGTTHVEALNLAIDLERKSQKFFNDFAKQLDDPKGRKIFRDFAREERSHLKSLREEYARLKANRESAGS